MLMIPLRTHHPSKPDPSVTKPLILLDSWHARSQTHGRFAGISEQLLQGLLACLVRARRGAGSAGGPMVTKHSLLARCVVRLAPGTNVCRSARSICCTVWRLAAVQDLAVPTLLHAQRPSL